MAKFLFNHSSTYKFGYNTDMLPNAPSTLCSSSLGWITRNKSNPIWMAGDNSDQEYMWKAPRWWSQSTPLVVCFEWWQAASKLATSFMDSPVLSKLLSSHQPLHGINLEEMSIGPIIEVPRIIVDINKMEVSIPL
jgi:dolichyl-phosphate-mannose--protein O-mannosyl transferase